MDGPIDYGQYERGRHLNYWSVDRVLQREAERVYPDDAFPDGRERLLAFGAAVGETVADNADVVDRHDPTLHTHDRHGEVVNEVEYHPAQHENERLVYADHGIVADVFAAPPDRDDPLPMVHTLAMQYLLSYADVGLTCPVAMTAGVALVLDKFGADSEADLSASFDGLTARSADDLVEGAMYLTEKDGGSDVGGGTKTTARRGEDDPAGAYRLTGEKWFCSNVDAGATLALARREGAPEGVDGLSLFLLPDTVDGDPNTVYRRLKDKLGTKSVPTGEVELDESLAYLIGDAENGFRQMVEMVNLERLSNAVAACGLMGRALLEAKIHAANREAFGRTLDGHPLMRADLGDLAVTHEAATTFTFEAARQFDRRERTGERDAYQLMRLLVPIAKYRTGREVVDTCSYAMEILGGNGYVRDFVTHRLLRDAQVLPIWEGASNVLALDVLRAMDREEAHEPWLELTQRRLDAVDHPLLDDLVADVEAAYHDLVGAMAEVARHDAEAAQARAKRLTDAIYDVTTATLLLDRAASDLADHEGRSTLVATAFVERHLRHDPAHAAAAETTPDEWFDPVVRFDAVDPVDLDDPTGFVRD